MTHRCMDCGSDNCTCRSPLSLVDKLARQEQDAFQGTFLAPVVPGCTVTLRIQGIVHKLEFRGDFRGFAVLRRGNRNLDRAKFVREATREERDRYLELLPRVRLIAIKLADNAMWAIPASTSGNRIAIQGAVPVNLPRSVDTFETFYARFDGQYFWFDKTDKRRGWSVVSTLRDRLREKAKPGNFSVLGCVPQEYLAYKMLFIDTYDTVDRPKDDNTRITDALKHSGANLGSWRDAGAGRATVSFSLDGQNFNVIVNKADLSVQSSGICLSGKDSDFDLSSLVSVFREKYGSRDSNQEEDEDW